MRMNFKAVLLALVALSPQVAHADDSPMSFSLQGDHILADGVFAPDTNDQFKAFLAENGKADGPWNIALYIRSPGGALGAAMDIGHMLREHEMSVVTFELCASACTYMMMGGVNRVVAKDTQFGVHQFSFADATADPDKPVFSAKDLEAHQNLLADLTDYADSMGIDTHVVTLASHTPPGDITNLTREQLTSFAIDNVPTDQPDGQDLANINIPSLTATGSADVAELPQLDGDSATNTVKLEGLAQIISKGISHRMVMAQTMGPITMTLSLANSYTETVNYNGKDLAASDVTEEKRRMAREWPVQRRTIDEATVQATCVENNTSCTVTGDYDSELGMSEDGVISKTRWHFTHEILLPLALPRVSSENETEVK
jgi:Clp protease